MPKEVWLLKIYFQETGSKNETGSNEASSPQAVSEIEFWNRKQAIRAGQKMVEDYRRVGPEDVVHVDSATGTRITFVKQHYRRSEIKKTNTSNAP